MKEYLQRTTANRTYDLATMLSEHGMHVEKSHKPLRGDYKLDTHTEREVAAVLTFLGEDLED